MMEIGLPQEKPLVGIDDLWDLIENRLSLANSNPESLSIYQDACTADLGHDMIGTITEVAKKGSRNCKIIIDLVDKGAQLKGTESFWRLSVHALVLVLSFYFVPFMLIPTNWLTHSRDKYIAQQINKTLTVDNVGILFLGMDHIYFHSYLAPDIVVKNIVTQEEIMELMPELGDI